MKNLTLGVAACALFANAPVTLAHDETVSVNDSSGHAPAGVMADHMHKQGEWMIGYRDLYTNYNGLLDGSNKISNQAAMMQGYRMLATDMTMSMHMLDIMYAPTDNLTLMVMPHYMTMDMTMQGMMGTMSHKVSGWGDTKVAALYRLNTQGFDSHLTLGFSLPTGDIDQTNRMGMLTHYSMQLGSGTLDAEPSYTVSYRHNQWHFGGQAAAVVRLQSENDNGYRLGNQFSASAWAAYNISSVVSVNTRLLANTSDKIKGEYNKPHASSSPADFTDNYGKDIVELGVGFNAIAPSWLSKARIGLEYTTPLYQKANGIQLRKSHGVNLSLTLSL